MEGKKTKNIVVRVSGDLKERLDRIAEREHINLSSLIRDFLAQWAEAMEKKK